MESTKYTTNKLRVRFITHTTMRLIHVSRQKLKENVWNAYFLTYFRMLLFTFDIQRSDFSSSYYLKSPPINIHYVLFRLNYVYVQNTSMNDFNDHTSVIHFYSISRPIHGTCYHTSYIDNVSRQKWN